MTEDWFRNSKWSEAIARRFDEKLSRARRKEQYLRIQASTLARTHPVVALELLDRYFQLSDEFDHAQAYVDRATAFRVLGKLDDALAAYEAALAREAAFPRLKTQAYLELPYVIAVEGIRGRYAQALAILDAHKERLMFPVDHFIWEAVHAVVLSETERKSAAVPHVKRALAWSSSEHSGFRYHSTVGLVTSDHEALVKKLAVLGAA